MYHLDMSSKGLCFNPIWHKFVFIVYTRNNYYCTSMLWCYTHFKGKWGLLNIFGSFFFASNKSTMTNYGLWLTCLVHLLSMNWKPFVNINDLSLTCNKLERTHYCKSFHILLLRMINNLRGHTKLCQCYIVLNGYHLALSHSKNFILFPLSNIVS